MGVCERCKDVLEAPKMSNHSAFDYRSATVKTDFHVLHADYASLRTALDAQCGLCHRLIEALATSRTRTSNILAGHELCPDVDPSAFSMKYRLAFETESRSVVSFNCHIHAKRANKELMESCQEFLFLAPDQGPLQPLPEPSAHNGVSTASMDTIISWIATCHQHHAMCRREAAPSPEHRFSRVLDVGTIKEAPTVKLCLADQLPQDIIYTTLSHCWGGVQDIPTLTKDNLPNYLQQISIQSLPQTFQDAIHLTRRLGVQYLWIDSLCIIQDSEEDWLVQAAVMGETYRGSYVNIAATGTTNPHGGLFSTRNPVLVKALRLAVDIPFSEGLQSAEHSREDADELPRFRLEGNSTLVARYGESGGGVTEYVEARGDLNTCLGNDNGSFDENGIDFAMSAKDVRLVGTTLVAELRTVSGDWKPESIDVRRFWSSALGAHLRNNFQRIRKTFYDVGTDYYRKWALQIAGSQLCNRGWVVQERLLAPRVVHFTQQQLFWECVEARSCEERPGTVVDVDQGGVETGRMDFKVWDPFASKLTQAPAERPMRSSYIWSSINAMYGCEEKALRKDVLASDSEMLKQAKWMCYRDEGWTPTHPLIRYWAEILTTYSNARLTYNTDSLVAIQGLARILSMRSGFSYAAGLWKHQLPRQLLWTSFPVSQEKGSEQYVAPSWSWASVMGSGGIRGLKLDSILEADGAMDLIRILSVDLKGIVKDDKRPLGQLRSGRIRIRGRLMPLNLDLTAWPADDRRKDRVGKGLVESWMGSSPKPPVGQTFLMPVLFTRWSERLPDSSHNSLILDSTENKGVFRRVGTACLSSSCSLKHITLGLSPDKKVAYKESNNDTGGDGEVKDNIEQESTFAHGVRGNPQQELMQKRVSLLGSGEWEDALESVQTMASKRKPARARATDPAAVQKSRATFERCYWRLDNVARTLPSQPRRRLDTQPARGRRWDQPAPATDSSPGVRESAMPTTKDTRANHLIEIHPREAVAPHFYLEHIEDGDSIRYGHFVFDLV